MHRPLFLFFSIRSLKFGFFFTYCLFALSPFALPMLPVSTPVLLRFHPDKFLIHCSNAIPHFTVSFLSKPIIEQEDGARIHIRTSRAHSTYNSTQHTLQYHKLHVTLDLCLGLAELKLEVFECMAIGERFFPPFWLAGWFVCFKFRPCWQLISISPKRWKSTEKDKRDNNNNKTRRRHWNGRLRYEML